MDIALEEDTQHLDEIVEVGHGNMEKRNVTGLIGSIYWDYTENLSISRPDKALKRNFSGLQVRNNSHPPTGVISISVKDNASIIGGVCPLEVMDGMPISTDLSTICSSDTCKFREPPIPPKSIDPLDIGSIQILYDTRTSLIYVYPVANWVVLISNKQDRINQQDINFEYSFNIAERSNKLSFFMDQQWSQQENESTIMLGQQNIFTDKQVAGFDNETYWKDAVYKTMQFNNHRLLFSR